MVYYVKFIDFEGFVRSYGNQYGGSAPVSTQGTGDVVNARYYGTYETHLPSGGKIIIDSSGCKLEKFYRRKYDYAYVNTSYTRICTMSDTYFTATFSPNQVTWVNANGEVSSGSPSSDFVITGTVEARDDPYAPPRRYITVPNEFGGFRYWVDL